MLLISLMRITPRFWMPVWPDKGTDKSRGGENITTAILSRRAASASPLLQEADLRSCGAKGWYQNTEVRTENSTGQLALVAGASSGIGLELARLFVSHGYDLVVVDEDDGINSITVTALQPGPTDTNFFNRANMLDTKVGADKNDDPADGFEALMAGKDQVVTGAFKNKVQSTMTQVTPDKVTAEMHRKLSEPGSAPKVKDRDREVNP